MASFGDEEEEFEEHEVWGVMKHSKEAASSNTYNKLNKGFSSFASSSSNSAWGSKATTPRSIPRATASPPQQSSAPVDIPDWSKILQQKNKFRKNLWDDAYGNNTVHDDHEEYHSSNDVYGNGHGANHDYVDDDDDDEMVPPHEYLAKKFARTQIASYSMCEGVGRTLKGRDLSRLRNAILTKTGFLE